MRVIVMYNFAARKSINSPWPQLQLKIKASSLEIGA